MRVAMGQRPLDQLDGCALLSNGASRLVAPYRVLDWPALLGLLCAQGPDEVVRRVRQAEAAPSFVAADGVRRPDDASVAYCELRSSRHSSSRIA